MTKLTASIHLLFVCLLSMLLITCGGGSGGGSNPGDPNNEGDPDTDEDPIIEEPIATSFFVKGVSPSGKLSIKNFPNKIQVVLSRDVETVASADITVLASGGDGTFTDANETAVNAIGISHNDNIVTLDFTGHSENTDETYQILIKSSATFLDSLGEQLDGDESGSAGGDAEIIFEVDDASTTPTFTTLQNQVFTPNCTEAGCHSGASPRRGMSLEAGNTYSDTVEVRSVDVSSLKRIKIGDADNSYLVQKLEGTAASGQQMPRENEPLPLVDINKVRDWIEAGAIQN
jgi:hypothetical protein